MKSNYFLNIVLTAIAIELFVLILKVNFRQNVHFIDAKPGNETTVHQAGFREASLNDFSQEGPMEVKIVGIEIPFSRNFTTANVLPAYVYNPRTVGGKDIPLIIRSENEKKDQ